MSRFYILIGGFLIGVGLSGLVSYSASIFPNLRAWGFWMSVIVALVLIVAALVDDFACQFLGLTYQAYVSLLIAIATTLIIGGVIQWF